MTLSDDNITPNLDKDLRRVVALVALLNLAYFGVEFVQAAAIGSVSLFADSVDFLEDASVNLLIFTALTWSARRRARVGMALAGILVLPALALVWALWSKFNHPVPPAPVPLTTTGLGALAVNLSCAFLLVRFRHHKGSLTRAAFLSARNDAFANIAIIGAGLLTLVLPSAWTDVLVKSSVSLPPPSRVVEGDRFRHIRIGRSRSSMECLEKRPGAFVVVGGEHAPAPHRIAVDAITRGIKAASQDGRRLQYVDILTAKMSVPESGTRRRPANRCHRR